MSQFAIVLSKFEHESKNIWKQFAIQLWFGFRWSLSEIWGALSKGSNLDEFADLSELLPVRLESDMSIVGWCSWNDHRNKRKY